MEGRQDCKSCRAAYAVSAWDTPEIIKRKENGPPCDTCKPKVHFLNILPVEVYQLCSEDYNYVTQSVEGNITTSKMGLRAEAIKSAMDILEIKDDNLYIFKAVKIIGLEISKKCRH